MDRSHADVIVVGGGISGLTCAFWLARAGRDVRVFDQEALPGGCIRTLSENGFLFDLGPNTLAYAEGDVSRLCEAAGVAARLRDPGERAGLRFVLEQGPGRNASGGGLKPVPSSPGGFFTTPLLSLRGKARALREPFIPARQDEGEESVAAFVRRRLGAEFLDRIVTPFVSGVSAGDPERMSLRWALPSLHAMEARHGSLFRGAMAMRKEGAPRPRSVSFAGGLEELPRAIAAALGDRLALSEGVERVEWTDEGFEIALEGGGRLRATRLVLATPAPESARLLERLAGEMTALASVAYAPVVSVGLGFNARAFRRAPEGFGYLAGRGATRVLAGCLYMSSLFPERAPEGHVALTVLAGCTAHAEIIDWSEERILDAVLEDVRRGLGPIPAPVFRRVARWPRAIPQYNLGHGRLVREVEALERSFPGLHLLGAYLRGPSLADCIASGSRLAESILERGVEGRGSFAAGKETAATPI